MEHTMTEEEILKRAFAMPLTNPAFPPGHVPLSSPLSGYRIVTTTPKGVHVDSWPFCDMP
jgi:acetoacetate decarboxylase